MIKTANRCRFFAVVLVALVGAPGALGGPDVGEWVDLFDGQTLTGWQLMAASEKGHYQPVGESFQVEDEAIFCRQAASKKGAMLLTEQVFQDFELELEVWSDWGCDSGIMLRSTADGRGFQVLNDYLEKGSVGFAFGQGSGGYISRPLLLSQAGGKVVARNSYDAVMIDKLEHVIDAETFNRIWVQNGWNTWKIRCEGEAPRITTWINGTKVMGFNGATYQGRGLKHETAQNWEAKSAWSQARFAKLTGGRGRIGFQVHPGRRWAQDGVVRYRGIRIREIRHEAH